MYYSLFNKLQLGILLDYLLWSLDQGLVQHTPCGRPAFARGEWQTDSLDSRGLRI